MTEAEAAITELPSSPGARLRRERESRGLTQHQAAEHLTLDVTVVMALEADDYAALGAPVFARGHLRRYAALLDLAEGDILDGYEHSKVRPVQPTLIPRARVEMLPVRGRPKWPWVLGGAAAFLFAAALVAYLSANGLHLPGYADDGQDSGTAASAGGPTVRMDGNQPALTLQGTPGDAAAPGPAPATPASAAAPAGQVRLQLRFAADTWVEIYDGTGKAILYDLGKTGSERTVTAVAPLSVTVGNAPAVRMVINGRAVALPPLAAGQTVARFGIGADGILR